VIFPNPANRAPVIQAAVLPVPLKSKAVFDLKPLLSDPDDNLDINSLRIIELPKSGAKAVLDALQNLEVDYTDIVFGGREALKLQVCDQNLVCSQQDIVIEVVGEVVVFNGLSPDGDGINDEMIIQYVDILPNALENRVVILNRWGDVVFEIENYNNTDRVFTGKTNDGNDLPAGVYLYKIEFVTGRKYTGYVTLKR
jgi:gliding motility-associated-like protein